MRGDRSLPRDWKRFVAEDAGEALPDRRQALKEAERTLRIRLDELVDAIAAAAQERIAAAILPAECEGGDERRGDDSQ